MRPRKTEKGYTLLELMITIILLGVITGLALPRFFGLVEFSRSSEALNIMGSMRRSVERCYLARGGTFVGCTLSVIDIENPNSKPDSHFLYTIGNQTAVAFEIVATRNSRNGGDTTSTITLTQGAAGVTRAGTGVFAAIQ